MDLGDKIKELRKQKGMTQADLGLAVGVCYQSISCLLYTSLPEHDHR